MPVEPGASSGSGGAFGSIVKGISRGDPSIFLTRPISAAMLLITLILLTLLIFPAVKRKREEALQEA